LFYFEPLPLIRPKMFQRPEQTFLITVILW